MMVHTSSSGKRANLLTRIFKSVSAQMMANAISSRGEIHTHGRQFAKKNDCRDVNVHQVLSDANILPPVEEMIERDS